MTFREQCERLDTEALLERLRLDLRDDAKAVVLRLLAARGMAPATIQQVLADQAAREAEAFEQYERMASLGERLLAFAIDFAVWLLAMVMLELMLDAATLEGEAPFLFDALSWSYLLLRDAIPGLSMGKRLLGLRVVHLPDERPVTLVGSVLRNATLPVFVLDSPFVLGERRMRLGDMLAGTRVLRATAVGAHTPPEASRPTP